MSFVQAMWDVSLELAPFLLLGMAIAGVLHVLLPRDFVHRQFRGRAGVLKAVALGVPLPLCSCGVIPTGLGLRRDGASPGATVGFLISTPQTGVDSILVSAAFLGWPFALFKVAAAVVTGLAGGWMADALGTDSAVSEAPSSGSGGAARGPLHEMTDHALEILRTIWHWIVVGVVASALITVFVPDGALRSLAGEGVVVPVLLALVVSLPLYVCATASVPIAAALVASGFPPGAALVFLMAGPATNVATIGAIKRALGARALAAYLVAIVAGSVGLGIAFDFLLETAPVAAAHVHTSASWWRVASVAVLALLVVRFAYEDARRFVAGRRTLASDAPAVEVGVAGMSCESCAAKLETALLHEPGVSGVHVTLTPGRAEARGAIDKETLCRIVREAGFEPETS